MAQTAKEKGKKMKFDINAEINELFEKMETRIHSLEGATGFIGRSGELEVSLVVANADNEIPMFIFIDGANATVSFLHPDTYAEAISVNFYNGGIASVCLVAYDDNGQRHTKDMPGNLARSAVSKTAFSSLHDFYRNDSNSNQASTATNSKQ